MKAELQKLYDQIKKLPTREQEVIRLRYADGLNYKDLASASNSSKEEVTALLLSGLNTLRGHKGKGDKTRYLAFVHGELNEADTQAMAELVESDPGARSEFESILMISDALTDLYDSLAEQSPKKKKKKVGASTLDKIRNVAQMVKAGKGKDMAKPRILIAGGLFAVAAAIVIYIFVDMKSGGEGGEETAAPTAEAPAAESAATGAAPVSDQAAIEAAKAADAANSAAIGTDPATAQATPPPATDPVAETAPTPATEPTPAPTPPPLPTPAPEPVAKVGAGKKVMMLDTAKTVIPKNINRKNALTFLTKKLNKVPSCVPASDKKTKAIKAIVGVTKDGTYTQVNVVAPTANKAAIVKCLKSKLGETAKSLRTTNKSGAKITLAVKIQ